MQPRAAELPRALLTEHFLSALGHILRRNVFDMLRDRPLVAEGIGDFAVTIAPEHILLRHARSRAGFDGLVICFIGIFHVQMNSN